MLLKYFAKALRRLRYPVSLPEEVAEALGCEGPNSNNLKGLFEELQAPTCCPRHIKRWMNRFEVERAFKTAHKQESFHQVTLVSYYFNQGWLEFMLEFDSQQRLRRLYVQHPTLKAQPFEIALKEC